MDQIDLVISGACDDRFSDVRAAFAANFAERGEVGASVTVIVGGKTVVDLAGGWANAAETRPWQSNTLVNVWSTTKGVAATCFAMLVDAGKVSYTDAVADYWPEFAAEGKGDVTIAQLLSHQAGLCGFAASATVEDLLSGRPAADRLAAQAPFLPLGTGSGYHAITGGILGTELFRRIEGRSIQAFVADELRTKRGLDVAIGLPQADDARRGELIAPPEMDSTQSGAFTPVQLAALANPVLDPLSPNDPAWRQADLPSANGHASAQGLASLYAMLIDGRLIGPDALGKAIAACVEGPDLVLGIPARWGAGFLLNSDGIYGPNDTAFGHSGWGGSFAFADPDGRVAMSYTMNRMGTQLRDDPRGLALINAVYGALA